jgi:hypothetical protein
VASPLQQEGMAATGWRMQMAGQCETSTGRRAQQWIGRSRVVIVLCWILLATTAATAQPNG